MNNKAPKCTYVRWNFERNAVQTAKFLEKLTTTWDVFVEILFVPEVKFDLVCFVRSCRCLLRIVFNFVLAVVTIYVLAQLLWTIQCCGPVSCIC